MADTIKETRPLPPEGGGAVNDGFSQYQVPAPFQPSAPLQPSPVYQPQQPPVYAPQLPVYLPPSYNNQPTTTTISTGESGWGSFIPSLLPALQSGSYVLVIIGGFVLWSSRNLLKDFLQKHITLVETVKVNLDKQLDTADVQMQALRQLTDNNSRLIITLEKHGLPDTKFPTDKEDG